MLMSGPLLTGYTQTINDYYDKEIDAINEPNRPIPSGVLRGIAVRHKHCHDRHVLVVGNQLLQALLLGLETAHTCHVHSALKFLATEAPLVAPGGVDFALSSLSSSF